MVTSLQKMLFLLLGLITNLLFFSKTWKLVDMYLNGEMPITVGGICQHTSDGAVTVRKYIKRLIDKDLLIRDHALIDGHIVMTLTVNMDRLKEYYIY